MQRMLMLMLGLLLAAPNMANARVVTHEDIWLMQRVGKPVVSPDGNQVVYTLTEPSYDPDKEVISLWISPSNGNAAPKRLMEGLKVSGLAAWSNDGSKLAFAAKGEGDKVHQIYVMDLTTAQPPARLTNGPNAARAPKWRPDGSAILFEADEEKSAEQAARKSKARIYDSMPVRYWNQWLDGRHAHLFVVDITQGAMPRDVLKNTVFASAKGFQGLFNPVGGGEDLQAVWTPDGQGIVFSAITNRDAMMREHTPAGLFHLSLAGGEPRRLTNIDASFSHAQFSQSGDAIFAIRELVPVPKGPLYSLPELARIDWPLARSANVLTADLDRPVLGFGQSRDGNSILFDTEDNGFAQVFKVSVQGGPAKALIHITAGAYGSVADSAAGPLMIFQTGIRAPELVRITASAEPPVALTHFNDDRLKDLDVPAPVHFWFKAKNGRNIHSIMFLPPNFDPQGHYPLIVNPHGGPAALSTDNFSARWNSHLLAAPGYVILQSNYAGSTGFGVAFADAVERDVLDGPSKEILEAAAEAIKRFAYIDGSRQAAFGGSYGGYLMNWFNGHTDQFKCLVSHAGAINNESQYGTNDGGIARELRMGGPVWEKAGQWNSQSPIRYAGRFKTPTLITQGENDFRVPLGESLTLFKILERRHVPTRLIVFPDTGHWVLRGEDSKLHMTEVANWLKTYL
jgi:dipeptidyl aminopeptidase/acylaminoacyl peptidase